MQDQAFTIYQIDFGTPEFDEALRLRYQVLREPLGLDYTAEQIAAEYADLHYALFLPSGMMAAYLCFSIVADSEYKMRQVAVHPKYQQLGLGKAIVKAAETAARQRGAKLITMHARDTAIPFYIGLDYQKIGEQFEEVGIAHFKMQKSLIEPHKS
jgi:ribosomal protein S18 acetylase RimI-like enzyme